LFTACVATAFSFLLPETIFDFGYFRLLSARAAR
jgi:hypothetical protein